MLDLVYLAACISFAFMLLTLIIVALKYAALLAVRVVVFVTVFVGVAFGSVLVASAYVSPLPFWTLLLIVALSAIVATRPLRRRP